ncbi:NUDIX domain-containing protein [Mesobaculum littorinae]|uniref:ADP-ribose pyrophosphatase n=1 Tax=Mesobaculum littorinae TaxID=2486419 RepID=A0A438AJ01_9RHOB|nr:NUDIX domain-containing protein [Mesobaculum littorinae]RVV98658.1 NUDIX domain-containing protein [Mesobaculum littorinae]
MTDIHLFGTLRDDALRARVLGRDIAGKPAVLQGVATVERPGADDPALVAGTGAEVPTLCLRALDADLRRRIEFYAGGLGCRAVELPQPGGPVLIFAPDAPDAAAPHDAEGQGPWDLAVWQAAWAPICRRAAEEAMGYLGRIDGATLAGRMPTIRVRASSWVRAQTAPAPRHLRRGYDRDRVAVHDRRQPYAHYFAVEEADLQHPKFNGGASDTLTRAAFVLGDAVTVLPYDPARDRVLLVEQFRYGPHVRGDVLPWSLEPVAGRIDPGEMPQEAIRRECDEEAGLTLGHLEPVASYYPSPGAVTEYLYSYVGLCDLPDEAGSDAGGKDDEGEDILSHVIGFDRLMELIALGEIDNAPLLLTAFWLAPRRRELAALA